MSRTMNAVARDIDLDWMDVANEIKSLDWDLDWNDIERKIKALIRSGRRWYQRKKFKEILAETFLSRKDRAIKLAKVKAAAILLAFTDDLADELPPEVADELRKRAGSVINKLTDKYARKLNMFLTEVITDIF